jgi:hypothetical protein
VSLELFRERIEAGEVDATVRAHLTSCAECRAHYDALTLAARALGDDGAAAEKERLFAALPNARRATWPYLAGGALAAGLALAVLLASPGPDPVGYRGAPESTEAAFSLRVYGKDAPGQRIHLIADFPGSREATVGMRAELQYFAKAPPPGQLLVVETTGPLKTLRAHAASSASAELVPVGQPFSVGAFGPGETKVCAALATSADHSLEELARDGLTRSPIACSVLIVSP